MRLVIQRVSEARVSIDGAVVATIGRGLLVLVGLARGDGQSQVAWAARRVAGVRIFPDVSGRMHAAVGDVGGAVLAVPQFTLLGDCRKGMRPSFTDAMEPEAARPLFARFVELLAAEVGPVPTGAFQATMQVALVNDGPVTLVLEA